ncbi:lytic polysaccharide monooxygenase [Providencia rettgeri]|uniref:lytic polysaccharide monooxygenase n=1 Tax=Providencia rettgeri TaxID=587 RepID=UPI0025A7EE47|nr:lytic polysaccharide monooxygenase [Providencia rettgeri]ELR5166294.1 lytic polysaccharide monooxygenase [Providencia rettgeri]ELR5245713.1 lytic polysaccharide monooxygenase [Providencia rettgeri]
MKKSKSYLAYICLLAISSLILISQANAHGYVKKPESRAYQCSGRDSRTPTNLNCGEGPTYSPHSIEGIKGFPAAGPADGEIAAGSLVPFAALNEQTPTRWNKINMSTGPNIFTWYLTVAHSTSNWRFYITKADWNNSAPLTRSSFELTPFCERIDNGAVPPGQTDINFQCNVPNDRQGYHVILATWDVADTPNAFYQVIDVNLRN